jgi:toxin ParE1/3/4
VRLRYTRPALADLNAINDYIAEQSPRGARRVMARLHEVFELLPSFPAMGGQTAHPRIRRTTISPYPYLIFYEVGDDEIIIHAIRHGARDPSSMPGSD